MASPKMLYVWVPSNRRGRDGAPKAMDGLNEIIADNRANKFDRAPHHGWTYLGRNLTEQEARKRWRDKLKREGVM